MDARTGTKRVREILRRLAGTDVVVDLPRCIPESFRYHGTVVAVGPRLVLLRALRDFAVDGLVVLRIADIDQVLVGDTERRKRRLIRATIAAAPPPVTLDVSGWPALFRSIRAAERFAIVEQEFPDDVAFDLGPVTRVGGSGAEIRFHDAAGHPWTEPSKRRFDRVTCVRIQDPYIVAFERHWHEAVPPRPGGGPHEHWPRDNSGVLARAGDTALALLRTAHRNRWMVQVKRKPRGRETVAGTVAGIGKRLILIARERDFEFDGWTIVRLKDVATVGRDDAAKFHDRVLAAEGRRPPPAPTIRITGWVQALTDLAAARTPLFVRWSTNAEPDNIVVGVVERVRARDADFRAVSSTARWWPGTVAVPLRSLTSVSVAARYERTLVGNASGVAPRPRTGPRD